MSRIPALQLATAVALLVLVSCSKGEEAPESRAEPDVRPPGAIIVNYTPDSADTFRSAVPDSLLVLDWLHAFAESTGTALATQSHAFGELVVTIGPRSNGDGGYWLYQVNGQMATKAVSDLRVSRRDTVTFTFK